MTHRKRNGLLDVLPWGRSINLIVHIVSLPLVRDRKKKSKDKHIMKHKPVENLNLKLFVLVIFLGLLIDPIPNPTRRHIHRNEDAREVCQWVKFKLPVPTKNGGKEEWARKQKTKLTTQPDRDLRRTLENEDESATSHNIESSALCCLPPLDECNLRISKNNSFRWLCHTVVIQIKVWSSVGAMEHVARVCAPHDGLTPNSSHVRSRKKRCAWMRVSWKYGIMRLQRVGNTFDTMTEYVELKRPKKTVNWVEKW